MSQITYELTLDYGEDGPDDGTATPEGSDIAQMVSEGLRRDGYESADVSAERQ